METMEIKILFIAFLFVCLGAYYLGKKKNLNLLRDVGRRGSIISLILLVATIFLTKDIFG
ncbi:MAG: hypothetical protein WC979_03495 [Candidatus Pacearchaeota archaeon]|jgi:amino acid transporter